MKILYAQNTSKSFTWKWELFLTLKMPNRFHWISQEASESPPARVVRLWVQKREAWAARFEGQQPGMIVGCGEDCKWDDNEILTGKNLQNISKPSEAIYIQIVDIIYT